MPDAASTPAPAGAGARQRPWIIAAGGFHERGGMDKANAALARHLAGRGTPVHLVAHDFAPEIEALSGVTVHRVARPAGAFLLGERFVERAATRLAARIPDALLVGNGGNVPQARVNWVHSVHAAWHNVDDGAPWWFRAKNRLAKSSARQRERRAFATARLILANSRTTQRDLEQHFGLLPGRVRTVYLGSDPTWQPPTEAERRAARAWLGIAGDAPIVAFVGALSHDNNKGFDTLWRAWQQLASRPEWDAHLVAAGGGSGVPAWRARIAAVPAGARVQLLGFTDRVRELLAAADVLVSPVRYEAYGLNVQEAFCRDVPAIVSRRAGIAERYPASLSPLVLEDPEDADALAERLLLWRREAAAWRERIQPLATTLRAYHWSHMAADLVGVVEAERGL